MHRSPTNPSNTKTVTYMETLEKDETITNLRKEFADCRSIVAEFDDLKYEIAKAERENRSLQLRNKEVVEECTTKIKGNKILISGVASEIEELESKIKKVTEKLAEKELHNQQTVEHLKAAKQKIVQCEQQNQKLQEQLQSKSSAAASLSQSLSQLLTKKKEIQMKNKAQSEAMEKQFNNFKTVQQKFKAEEALNVELREQLTLLKGQKSKLNAKVELIKEKVNDSQKKCISCELESQQLNAKHHQLEKETSAVQTDALALKESIDNSLTKNKDNTSKLKSLEIVLKESISGLNKKHTTKEKLSVQYSELLKDIEKAETLNRSLSNEIGANEQNNRNLIYNLKK